MKAALTIIRYPNRFIPFALTAMAVFRVPLSLNKSISFYKLMGCGRNGTFDKIPDLNQWVIITSYPDSFGKNTTQYGAFIERWLRAFKCETFTIFMEALEGHGTWDGRHVFGDLLPRPGFEGRIATLTRATIRISKLKYFWANVAPVAAKMATADGFIMSVGTGEVPWFKQATFSIWQNRESMKAFAYQMKEHREVIKKTREEKWYSEDMFVRFAITGTKGTLHGKNPVEENQLDKSHSQQP